MARQYRYARETGGSRRRYEQEYDDRREGGIFSLAAALCLMLFIISSAVVLTLNARWLYLMDISLLHIDMSSGMTTQKILENYDALIRYNQIWQRGVLVFPSLAMSHSGAVHFAEVKRIFDIIQLLCAVTGIISLVNIIRGIRSGRKRYLRTAGILTIVLPLVLGLLLALNWDRFFIGFHKLVFRNDYWLFDPATDPVITILPDEYFMHCAIMILVLVALGAALCLWKSRRSRW